MATSFSTNSCYTIDWTPSPNRLAEPILCFDTDCSYPFGPICSKCLAAPSKPTSTPRSIQQRDFCFSKSEPQTKQVSLKSQLNSHEKVSTSSPPPTPKRKQKSHKISDTSASSKHMHSWLSGLVTITLAYEMLQEAFIGGADEEDVFDNSVSNCDLCGVSVMKTEKEWHFLQCRYAHEERKKLEWFLKRRG